MSVAFDRMKAADEERQCLLADFLALEPAEQLNHLRRWRAEKVSLSAVDTEFEAIIAGDTSKITADLLLRALAREIPRAGLRGAQSRLRSIQMMLEYLRKKDRDTEKGKGKSPKPELEEGLGDGL